MLTWTKVSEAVRAMVRRDKDEHRRTRHHRGQAVHDEQSGHTPESALAELRARLEDGLARARLTKTDLAARTRLGRTTVQLAFQTNGPVPSAQTVTALANTLKLPAGELLALQRVAAGGGNGERSGLGRPIGQWDPHALEVHPAGTVQNGFGLPNQRILPGYVPREHDRILAETVREAEQGRSRMLVLVGESSTGKTRACWEAVQALAKQGWRLWHPFEPTRAEAALEGLHRVGPRTVVWLNESHYYFGDLTAGERIAAAVHLLLTSPQRGPVLVLGTLWPGYVKQYTALPDAGEADPHNRVRHLLAGRTVSVPTVFDPRALDAATALAEAGDRLLAEALNRARAHGRITQDLAGVPVLLERYRTGSPAAKALLEAAMDARRLGVGLHLPQAFLTDAAPDYLHDTDWNQLTADWAEKAYAELAEQVHGKQAPLSRVTPRPQRRPPGPSTRADALSSRPLGPVFRLADYLEQHGHTTRRHLCPPASFWHAAHTHLTNPDDLYNLTGAAQVRHRLQWAHHLRLRAADHGSADALSWLALMREQVGDWEGAKSLHQKAADHGDTRALLWLAQQRERSGDREGAENLAQQAADHGDTHALSWLAQQREKAGDQESAENLAWQAADHGNTQALWQLAQQRVQAGDREGAENLAREAADHGDTQALWQLALMREQAGDWEGAKSLHQKAADHGNTQALWRLARQRVQAGDREGAENLYRQAADLGDSQALLWLAQQREEAGDREGAENLAQQAADHGSTHALRQLAQQREQAGDRKGAVNFYRKAADHGDTQALLWLAQQRERFGDREGAENLAREAADHGDTFTLSFLAALRERSEDWEGAENLSRQAVDRGDTQALLWRAKLREEAGDREGAASLAMRAVNHGDTHAMAWLARLREGSGDREAAESLARQAADRGNTHALLWLAELREAAGDRKSAETLYRQAADHGDIDALLWLARLRERSGDRKSAETFARQAVDHGDTDALSRLAQLREQAGDREGAETLYRQAADCGDTIVREYLDAFARLWPYGLDPDGTPTPCW
ncbi:hypothetical protein ACIGDI_39700 [Streptomyces sp. NPDC085900]|uniref:hypothetical protein n=1 Tax=Streptomyces sp. NPDC085900 TaxID=3365737 RepID=UPI0037D8EE08